MKAATAARKVVRELRLAPIAALSKFTQAEDGLLYFRSLFYTVLFQGRYRKRMLVGVETNHKYGFRRGVVVSAQLKT